MRKLPATFGIHPVRKIGEEQFVVSCTFGALYSTPGTEDKLRIAFCATSRMMPKL
jgi:hypothetical protein